MNLLGGGLQGGISQAIWPEVAVRGWGGRYTHTGYGLKYFMEHLHRNKLASHLRLFKRKIRQKVSAIYI